MFCRRPLGFSSSSMHVLSGKLRQNNSFGILDNVMGRWSKIPIIFGIGKQLGHHSFGGHRSSAVSKQNCCANFHSCLKLGLIRKPQLLQVGQMQCGCRFFSPNQPKRRGNFSSAKEGSNAVLLEDSISTVSIFNLTLLMRQVNFLFVLRFGTVTEPQ